MIPRAEIKRRNEETEQRTGAPPKLKVYDTMNARAGPALPGAHDIHLRAQLRARPQDGAVPDLDEGRAGLWRDWPDSAFSFPMLTVNADHHRS